MFIKLVRAAGVHYTIVDGKRWSCFVGRTWCNSEPPKPLAEFLLLLTVDHRLGIVVALHGPNPIIESILEIADTTVGIPHGPTRDQFLSHVSDVIARGVLHIDSLLTVLNDHPAAVANQSGWDTQLSRKDGKLIRDAVMIRVFANANPVTALTGRLKFVWIIYGFA